MTASRAVDDASGLDCIETVDSQGGVLARSWLPPTMPPEARVNLDADSFTDLRPNPLTPVDPADHGVAGDGTTDDTAAIQAALGALTAGQYLDGKGRTYLVSALNIDSGTRMANFSLRTKPAGAEGHGYSPITVGAYSDTRTRSEIVLRNVHVDGQRTQQTGVSGAEDGARHGFRILGPVTDLWLVGCSATNCATDGLCFYRGTGMGSVLSASDGIKKRLYVVDSDFTDNGRHGASGESVNGAAFVGCRFNGNGRTFTYANGVDIEEYADTDWFGNLTFLGCEFLDNARAGLLAYSGAAVKADAQGFTRRGPIDVVRCTANQGRGTWGVAYEFTPTAANKALGAYYDRVTVRNSTADGYLTLRSCSNPTVHGGSIVGRGATDLLLDYSTGVRRENVTLRTEAYSSTYG